MKAEGAKDLLGEGIRPEGLTYEIEFEVSGSAGIRLRFPARNRSSRIAKTLQDRVRSSARKRSEHQRKRYLVGTDASTREKTDVKTAPSRTRAEIRRFVARANRDAKGSLGQPHGEAQVYRWESLQPGNRVAGCAILEGVNTTYFVPEGWTMVVDRFGNGALTKRSENRLEI